jgi:hypothetical protein
MCRTPRCSPISRRFARVVAKKQPCNRSPLSLCIRLCQFSALHPSRSKIPAGSAEIDAFPWRSSRPACSTMSIDHRETTDAYRKELRKFLEPVLNPFLELASSQWLRWKCDACPGDRKHICVRSDRLPRIGQRPGHCSRRRTFRILDPPTECEFIRYNRLYYFVASAKTSAALQESLRPSQSWRPG